jgi:hypothetical protein
VEGLAHKPGDAPELVMSGVQIEASGFLEQVWAQPSGLNGGREAPRLEA